MTRAAFVLAIAFLAFAGCGGTESDDGTGGTGGAGGSAGVGTGGAAGSGGGSAGVIGFAGECKTDDDCQLVNDCCRCDAISTAAKIPVCDAPPCFAPLCDGMGGVSKARCIAGQCSIGLICDPAQALCNMAAPACPAGTVPRVLNGCWGECVPPTDCESVGTCFDCSPNSSCVVWDTQAGAKYQCVNPPPECGASPGCACLGPKSCLEPYGQCQDGIKDGSAVHCGCPDC